MYVALRSSTCQCSATSMLMRSCVSHEASAVWDSHGPCVHACVCGVTLHLTLADGAAAGVGVLRLEQTLHMPQL